MNFLAHLHLSDGTPGSMLGGILADFVKGPDVAALPPDILAGVRLHRHIDAFTDRHAVVQRSIHRVSAKLGWFAGIVIDIYYDHVLAFALDHPWAITRPMLSVIAGILAARMAGQEIGRAHV